MAKELETIIEIIGYAKELPEEEYLKRKTEILKEAEGLRDGVKEIVLLAFNAADSLREQGTQKAPKEHEGAFVSTKERMK